MSTALKHYAHKTNGRNGGLTNCDPITNAVRPKNHTISRQELRRSLRKAGLGWMYETLRQDAMKPEDMHDRGYIAAAIRELKEKMADVARTPVTTMDHEL